MSKRRERSKRRKQKQKQQMMLAVGGVVVAIALAIAVIFIVQDQAEVDVCDASDEDCYATYAGLEQGLTSEGIPYIGNPNSQVVVAEFSDFTCPHCADFHPQIQQVVEDYVRSGQIRLEYRPMAFVAQPYADRAANAALCVAEQGAFWQFHDEIFELHKAEGVNSFDNGLFEDMVEEMGLDKDEYKECLNSNRPRVGRANTQDLYRQLELGGTPSIGISYDGGQTWRRIATSYDAIASAIP